MEFGNEGDISLRMPYIKNNMTRLETLEKAAELVERVLQDLTNLNAALDQWPKEDPADHSLLESTKWQLTYIDNDEDIRSKEPDYEKRQLEYLRFLCEKIRERIKSVEP
jgi:hypothetical protein